MKVAENSPQNERNCTILKKFLGGTCPQTPLAKAHSFAARDMPLRGMYIQNPRNFKVGPPPLRSPAYAPGRYVEILTRTRCIIFLFYIVATCCSYHSYNHLHFVTMFAHELYTTYPSGNCYYVLLPYRTSPISH